MQRKDNDRDLRRNGAGYYDPTAYEAIKNADRDLDAERFHKLLETIFNICELSGFRIEGRITLRDKRSGKVWK